MSNTGEGVVRVVFGVHDRTLHELIGMTVGKVREQYGSTFNLPTGAVAKVHGELAAEDYVLVNGDVLVFTPPPGNTVICGANRRDADLAGKTVEVLRRELTDELSIAPDAKALVNGKSVPEKYSLKRGDKLEFIRPAGSKG